MSKSKSKISSSNRIKLEQIAEDLGKDIKTEDDLGDLTQTLIKMTIEKALAAEMDHHLGYEKHEARGRNSGNSRNGYSAKTLKGDIGEVVLETPRDRNAEFEPQIVQKSQSRLMRLDEQILKLYSKGMTTRDIADFLKDMYDTDVSASLISRVTDAVQEEIVIWQNRPLDEVYAIVYLDCLVVKVHQDKRVINKAICVALGVNLEGHKELLGLWITENEGAKFWLSVVTELQNRGVKDMLIACVDGLKGFPEAINSVFPKTKIQLCIVHLVRNSLKFVPWKDYKAVTADLKLIYRSITVDDAKLELERFAEKWDGKYPKISDIWRRNWVNWITLFDYPEEVRKAIYTTNAIESLNSVIRKGIKNRKIFANDSSAIKQVYLATREASKKWTMPIRNWRGALNCFVIEFGDRVDPYI